MWKAFGSAAILVIPAILAISGAAASLNGIAVADLFSTSKTDNTCDQTVNVSHTTNASLEVAGVTATGISDDCWQSDATLVVLVESGGNTIAARSGSVVDSSGDSGDDVLTLVPDDNGDAAGGNLAPEAGSTINAFLRNGTVSIDPIDLSVNITSP